MTTTGATTTMLNASGLITGVNNGSGLTTEMLNGSGLFTSEAVNATGVTTNVLITAGIFSELPNTAGVTTDLLTSGVTTSETLSSSALAAELFTTSGSFIDSYNFSFLNSSYNNTIAHEATTSATTNFFSDEYHNPPYYIVFIFGSTGFGAILRMLLRKWANMVDEWKWGSLMKIPYTVFLLLVGMAVAGIALIYPDEIQHYLLSEIDPELFLHVFLPVVIFESAYVIDIHVFWRSIGHVSMLAVPGLLLATSLTGMLSLMIPEIRNIEDLRVKIYIALIFGSIVSATDPVAVVALLKELGCQKYLSIIIEGEALLNDGAAIVVFKICLELLKAMTPYFPDATALSTFQLIVQQSLLGPIIGWIMAKVASFILQKIYNDALAEITITLSFTYLTFYIGEVCKTSGVLGVVTFGLALDRASITPQVDHFLHRFWEMLAYLSNTLIFVICGVIVTKYMEQFGLADFAYLVTFYVGLTVIRTISIFAFYPMMKRLDIELTWRHMFVMIWGGLRGAVGLALAVYLQSFSALLSPHGIVDHGPQNQTASNIVHKRESGNFTILDDEEYEAATNVQRHPTDDIDFKRIFLKILMHTGGIVLFTLVINASTIQAVLKKLGMLDVTHAQQVTMQNAVNRIQSNLKRTVNILKYDRFLADAKWKLVEEYTHVEYPYKDLRAHPTAAELSEQTLHISRSEDLTFKDLFEEARIRVIKALKMSYGKQYTHGLLSDQEARILIQAADTAADRSGEFIDVESIRKTWNITGVLPYIKRKIEYWMYGRKVTVLLPPRNRHRRRIFRIVTSDKFEILMQCVIVLNIIPISMDFAVEDTWPNAEVWAAALQITNFVFIGVYCVELALKYIGLGGKQFIRNGWIQFDILILIISFVEIFLDAFVFQQAAGAGTGTVVKTVRTTKVLKFSKVTKIIRTLRATRILRLTKTVLPSTVEFINHLINRRLGFGYNVGKGFVTAEEEVNKLIGSICENKKIQRRLQAASDQNRLMVTREMGLLQRDHPGIAISVKTRNAIRTILNNSRDAISQLCAGGVLDETEMQLLERGVEVQQKRLANFPAYVSPSEPMDILEDILWVKDQPELLQYIKTHAQCMDYDFGDVIIEEDEEFDGIHVIVHGMVRLVGALEGHVQNLRVHEGKATSDMFKVITGVEEDDEDLKKEEDFLGTGNIFGDIALLTEGQKMCTVTCETAVQTYFISKTDMEEAFEDFPFLRKTMWKVAAIRIATPLYLEHFEYQGLGSEQIHLHLSQGYIVELTNIHATFTFQESVVEALLVHGCVSAKLTHELIESPFLIMPDVEEITLSMGNFAILLVIPRESHMLEITHSSIGIFRSNSWRRRSSHPSSPVHHSRKVSQVAPAIQDIE